MKLALITDPRGFKVVDTFDMAYHLVLAQEVLTDVRYAEYYREKSERGHFIMMDNGAAEDVNLTLGELLAASEKIHPEEIILPDVMCDMKASMKATMDPDVLAAIPPKRRAVVPQGNTLEEWLVCANEYVENLEFMTLCIPKHAERFPGGRAGIMNAIQKLKWHYDYNIHLLGIWGDPVRELALLKPYDRMIRGIDTAAPFAWAQRGLEIGTATDHISHSWGRKFNFAQAYDNVNILWSHIWRYENARN